mmetsp:Transcript_23683/g.25294  ORF Transcript_23683/g.25294 Transcript_23683/m.25294 type:complete len:344 (+) Transcript_23683:271-1302(+)
MSYIRQRRGPSPSRDSLGGVPSTSTSWEIATDSGDNINTTANSDIPMYNPKKFKAPLIYDGSSPSNSSTATSVSRRVSWNTIMAAKKANTDYIREDVISNNYHQQIIDQPGSTLLGSSKGAGYMSLRDGRNLSSLTPTLVPDLAYRAYLSGRPNDKQYHHGSVKIQVATFFGYFSLVGFLFLTFVGILIDTQPMFLQGVMPKHVRYSSGKSQTFYATDIKDRLEPATHAYHGAILYLLTALICLGYANNVNWFLFRKRWQQYRDIDDIDSTVTTFHDGSIGGNDEFLPASGAIHQQAYSDHNGYIARTWHSMLVKCQRFGIYLASIWQARHRNRRRSAGAKDV